MASKASGSHKSKKNTLPKFEAEVYSGIPSGDLIVFSVHYLIEQKIKVTLEDIVSICFRLFPQKFGLKKFPKWPDSALVGRRWGDVRKKEYVAANAQLEYRITSKGSSRVKKVEKILGIAAPKPITKMKPALPKKEPVTLVKKTQPSVSKEKAAESAKKVKALKPKAPTVIQKKIAQLFQQEKISPLAPAQKTRPVRAKKEGSAPAPVKQAQVSEIKARPAVQAKQSQSAKKEKVTSPMAVKKTGPAQAKKTVPAPEPVKQAQASEIKVRPAIKTKKAQPVQKGKVTLPAPIKKIRPIRVKKTTPAVEIKAHPPIQTKKKLTAPSSKPAEKAIPIQPSKAVPTSGAKETRPIAIPRVIKPQPVKKTKPVAPIIVQPEKAKKVQPQKAVSIPSINVTREEKERAGKFTRMMERSDAYVQYKKHGIDSKINEFDFRSLLLCTMESSAETLARNVKLFKGYAGIHNRQDLTAFLVFCEDKFSYLLKPQNKSSRKAKK